MRYLMGLITGFVAGAAFGLLFAPKSGQEMRTELSTAAQAEWETAHAQLRKEMASVQQQLSKQQAQGDDVGTQSDTAEDVDVEEVDVEVEADA